jgi:LysM repeat protein
MNLNSITTDRASALPASTAANSGGESFQLAYAKVFDGRYAPAVPAAAPDRAPLAQPAPLQPTKTAHTVHAGETLTAIARARLATMGAAADAATVRHGVAQLASANNLRNPDRIYAGQKLDLAALDAAFGRNPAAVARVPAATGLRDAESPFTGSERIASRYEVASNASWHQDEFLPAEDVEVVASAPAPLPVAIPPFPPAGAVAETDTAIEPLPPIAARQVALYEQNAVAGLEKSAEPPRALPDILYKGVAGKVLDALPIEPSTRANLQRANTIVSSAFTARSLGALTGLGGPLLTVAGLLWGVFSSRQIEAAPAGEAKPVPDTNPVVDTRQTAQTRVADAVNVR